jgi:hypothetical protein
MSLRDLSYCLLLAGFLLAACQPSLPVLQKNAQGDELQKETTIGVTLPPGCPKATTFSPLGKRALTVSYREPTAYENGAPLKDLAFTTIYLTSPESPTQAIRVWTNDSHGGAMVTINNVVPPDDKFGICVTASNWARMESSPATQQIPSIR